MTINIGGWTGFTAEDFKGVHWRGFQVTDNVELCQNLADRANAILAKKLGKAPVKQGNSEFDVWADELDSQEITVTHTARLVCIELASEDPEGL